MKKIVLILFLTNITLFTKMPSFIKKQKKITTKKSPAQLKEQIGYELEDILTLSSDLIASLSKGQKLVVSKMHTLVSPEKGDFFSNVKAKDLEMYAHHLEQMHQELKDIEQRIKKECTNFSKNFTH